MKYFSLFTGAGGFEIGMPQSLYECVGMSEIDRYASDVLRYRFPNTKNYGDIKTIDWSTVPDFDLLVGGSPCQDFSIAGKREGIGGKRSGLFYEYVRALEEKKPTYFIWENVKGVLSSAGGRDFAFILLAFSEAGYSLQWQVLNAKDFGVPQNRERVFVIGTRGDGGREVFFEAGHSEEDSRRAGEEIAKGTNTTEKIRRQVVRVEHGSDPGEPSLRQDGTLSDDPDSRGGSAHPSLPRVTRQPLRFLTRNQKNIEGDYAFTVDASQTGGVRIREATKTGFAIAEEGDSINLTAPNSTTRRGRVGKGIANTLDTGMQQHTLTKDRIRRLTPLECERLMSWPDDWTRYGCREDGTVYEVSDSQRYKMCGNGVVSAVVEQCEQIYSSRI